MRVAGTRAGDRARGRPPAGRLISLVIGSVAFAVLFVGSWGPAWSRDEAASVMVVRRPWSEVWRTWAHDPALEPYYLLMDPWAEIATSEVWLRLPSVAAGTAAVVLLHRILVRFVAPAVAVLATASVLGLPAVSRYAQEARPYALSMALATLVVLWWLQDRQILGWRRWVRLVTVLVALGLLQAYALLILAVLLVVAVVTPERDRRRETLAVVRVGLITVVLLAPFLWLLATRAGGEPNPPDVSAVNVVVELVRLPAGVLRPPGAVAAGTAALVLAIAGVAIGLRMGGRHRVIAVLGATWLFVPPLLLTLLQVTSGTPGLVARYWTLCLPAFGVAAAPVLDRLWRWRRPAALAVLAAPIALGLPSQGAIRGPDGHAGQGWRALPALLDDPALADAAVLAEGSSYRVLVANDPGLAARMPLVIDPAPSGRVLPQTEGGRSPAFRRLVRERSTVLVLQNLPRTQSDPPDVRDLTAHRQELRAYPRVVVLCAYFGDGLAVASRDAADPVEAQRLADQLTAVDPRRVTCATPDAG